MIRAGWILLAVVLAAACGRDDGRAGAADAGMDAGRDADFTADSRSSVAGAAAGQDAPLTEGWPDPGVDRIDVRRERSYDMNGDGRGEVFVVTARGTRYDSLDIALLIRDIGGDSLWVDRWSSRSYFKYIPLDEQDEATVVRIVRAHVDSLLIDGRFAERGMPRRFRRENVDETIAESVRYHLAEIDWRGGASLDARDPTPPEAHNRITAANVAPERVRVVRQELESRPTFMYHAGGEVTYVIGWSQRENSFVRLYSCC
ncbi:hypothetical protein BH23GEM9_BH23GEM9_16420 [soil metagenome]